MSHLGRSHQPVLGPTTADGLAELAELYFQASDIEAIIENMNTGAMGIEMYRAFDGMRQNAARLRIGLGLRYAAKAGAVPVLLQKAS